MARASGTKRKPSERWSLPARQERSRATRARLLEAAETVFAEKGYDGAKIADIAEEAGCSVGAVYFRFKDKSALFSAIAESFIEETRGRLPKLLQTDPEDRETTLRRFVMATAATVRHHRGLFRAIVERGLDHPQAMRNIFTFRDELAAALEQTLRGSRGPSLDIRVTTQMIYGFLIVGVLNVDAPTRIGDTRAIGALADACVAYLNAGDPL